MIPTLAQLLTDDQVAQVHDASLEILEQVGMKVRNANARQIYKQHGCELESSSEVVKIPRKLVKERLITVPHRYTFYGRDPKYDRTLPDDSPLIVPGSSAPDILDPVSGEVRRSTSTDIANIAQLVNELPGYDIFSLAVVAGDAPEGQYAISRFYPALKNCLKPIRGSAPDLDEYQAILRMGEIIAGGKDAFWKRPFLTFQYCAVVSPLTFDVNSTEKLICFTREGIPSYGVVAPNAGVTAPFTLLGALALTNAEFLAQVTLEQAIRPGKPTIYDALPTAADIRDGAYAPGAIETSILSMGCAQMSRFYKIPNAGFIGLSNAKSNDAQSGYETGMSGVAGALGGVDLLNMGGLLDALMVFDYAKLVIDNEIAMMIKQIKKGFRFSEENFALDVIKQTGPGGMYVGNRHTVRNMRKTAFLPQLANRQNRNTWMENGMPEIQDTALRKAREILIRDNPAVFSQAVDDSIRRQINGLVPGNTVSPRGW